MSRYLLASERGSHVGIMIAYIGRLLTCTFLSSMSNTDIEFLMHLAACSSSLGNQSYLSSTPRSRKALYVICRSTPFTSLYIFTTRPEHLGSLGSCIPLSTIPFYITASSCHYHFWKE